jgi:hypothetical protein
MNENDALEPTPIDQAASRRAALRHKHQQRLAQLMLERADLRGVHALADFVDDAVRWSA